MIPADVIALVLSVAVHSPELAGQVGKLWADTAHGKGGAEKIGKAFADLAALFGTAAGVAATVQAPVAAQQQPQ
jgi:hypothetical protein